MRLIFCNKFRGLKPATSPSRSGGTPSGDKQRGDSDRESELEMDYAQCKLLYNIQLLCWPKRLFFKISFLRILINFPIKSVEFFKIGLKRVILLERESNSNIELITLKKERANIEFCVIVLNFLVNFHFEKFEPNNVICEV